MFLASAIPTMSPGAAYPRRVQDGSGGYAIGSADDPYLLGDPMDTRTIAILALVIAVGIVVILFVL